MTKILKSAQFNKKVKEGKNGKKGGAKSAEAKLQTKSKGPATSAAGPFTGGKPCMVPKYSAAVDYTPRLRAPRNLPRCTANSDTSEAVANHYPGSATANSYLGTMST